MSKKIKRREKKYNPKKTSGNALAGVFLIGHKQAQDKPLDEERQQAVINDYYASLTAFANGVADGANYDTLAYGVNFGRLLGEMGLGGEYGDLIYDAMAAVHRIRVRFNETGKFGIDGEGLKALRDFAPLHEEQVRLATHAELDAAKDEMHRRVGTLPFELRPESQQNQEAA